jgi:hypothetical protein
MSRPRTSAGGPYVRARSNTRPGLERERERERERGRLRTLRASRPGGWNWDWDWGGGGALQQPAVQAAAFALSRVAAAGFCAFGWVWWWCFAAAAAAAAAWWWKGGGVWLPGSTSGSRAGGHLSFCKGAWQRVRGVGGEKEAPATARAGERRRLAGTGNGEQ